MRSSRSGVRVGEMVHWVKDFAAKPEDLSLIPGTYKVAGEK